MVVVSRSKLRLLILFLGTYLSVSGARVGVQLFLQQGPSSSAVPVGLGSSRRHWSGQLAVDRCTPNAIELRMPGEKKKLDRRRLSARFATMSTTSPLALAVRSADRAYTNTNLRLRGILHGIQAAATCFRREAALVKQQPTEHGYLKNMAMKLMRFKFTKEVKNQVQELVSERATNQREVDGLISRIGTKGEQGSFQQRAKLWEVQEMVKELDRHIQVIGKAEKDTLKSVDVPGKVRVKLRDQMCPATLTKLESPAAPILTLSLPVEDDDDDASKDDNFLDALFDMVETPWEDMEDYGEVGQKCLMEF